MGNCIVIQRSHSASKLQCSPLKENRLCSELTLKPQSPPMARVASFQEFSVSKDEIFFDANTLMDSDCDDFFSVTGGTPLGSTPVHPMANKSCTEAPPRLDKTLYVVDTSNSTPEHSPTEMKQLIEFFRESFTRDGADRDQYLQGFMEMKPKSPASNDQYSTPLRKQKSAQCCLPSLVRSLSMSDRKKRASFKDSG